MPIRHSRAPVRELGALLFVQIRHPGGDPQGKWAFTRSIEDCAKPQAPRNFACGSGFSCN